MIAAPAALPGPARRAAAPVADVAVAAEGVVKRYRGADALAGVSLTVERGEVLGLLGPNGAGKTTLVETFVGLRKPDRGTVRVLGLDPVAERARLVRRVGFQPQSASLFARQTVRETLELWAGFSAAPRTPVAVAEATGVEGLLDTQLRRLTRGQRQRVLLAIALVGRPDLIILDEPSDGLDPRARRLLWDAIAVERDRGATIILTTHGMEEAEALCDRVAVIDRGHVLAHGAPAALVAQLADTQTIEFHVEDAPSRGLLNRLPAVTSAEVREGPAGAAVRLRTADTSNTLRALLDTPELEGAWGLRVHPGTLEDAFLTLTGRRLDDDEEAVA